MSCELVVEGPFSFAASSHFGVVSQDNYMFNSCSLFMHDSLH